MLAGAACIPPLEGAVGIRLLIEAGKISELILFQGEALDSFRLPAGFPIVQAAIRRPVPKRLYPQGNKSSSKPYLSSEKKIGNFWVHDLQRGSNSRPPLNPLPRHSVKQQPLPFKNDFFCLFMVTICSTVQKLLLRDILLMMRTRSSESSSEILS